MTAVEFVTAAFCDEWTYNTPQHITPEEAAYTMRAWADEGMQYPPTLTPVLFSRVWNILCDKHITNA